MIRTKQRLSILAATTSNYRYATTVQVVNVPAVVGGIVSMSLLLLLLVLSSSSSTSLRIINHHLQQWNRHYHHRHHDNTYRCRSLPSVVPPSTLNRVSSLYYAQQQSPPPISTGSATKKKSQPQGGSLVVLRSTQEGHDDDNDYNEVVDDNDDSDATGKGIAVLMTVPLAWGTFEVAVRYVYTLPLQQQQQQEHPMAIPSLLFSVSYYAVATLALVVVNQITSRTTTSTTASSTTSITLSRQLLQEPSNSMGSTADSTKQQPEQPVVRNDTSIDVGLSKSNNKNDNNTLVQNNTNIVRALAATTTTTSVTTNNNDDDDDDDNNSVIMPWKQPQISLLSEPIDQLLPLLSSSSSSLPYSLSNPDPTASSVSSLPTTATLRNGGIELGTYLFVGNLFQLFGLRTVPSDRAAFLLQLTTIFVPIGAILSTTSWSFITTSPTNNRERQQQQSSRFSTRTNTDHQNPTISIRMWIACVIALFGVGIMSFENDTSTIATTTITSTVASSNSNINNNNIDVLLSQFHWSMGDTLIVLAAISYTFHCLRLDVFAKQCPNAIELATYKAGTEMVWTMIAILISLLSVTYGIADNDMTSVIVKSGNEIQQYWIFLSQQQGDHFDFVANAPIFFAIVWTGLVPIAYTIAAQTYGQRRVAPVTANLIYTVQPLGTAFFAYVVLHEKLSVWGYIGGFVIGIAVLLILTVETPTKSITVETRQGNK